MSVETLKVGLTFPLDFFVKSYLYSSSLTPIQLMPNSWAYLPRFTKYAKLILGVEPTILLFRSMFIISTKKSSDYFDTTSSMDMDVKRKFNGLFFKVRE